nr:hypothetical protein [Patescibacteria group bacterium]
VQENRDIVAFVDISTHGTILPNDTNAASGEVLALEGIEASDSFSGAREKSKSVSSHPARGPFPTLNSPESGPFLAEGAALKVSFIEIFNILPIFPSADKPPLIHTTLTKSLISDNNMQFCAFLYGRRHPHIYAKNAYFF